ncbi:MAG TPA: preprotein translocase subunit SecA, partial [Planctomycetota bacterium]|nr:preprotein translocase subunit SecA [Planctomycetota bacterium]
VGNIIGTIFPSRSASVLKKLAPVVEKINALEKEIAKLSDKELRGKTEQFRKEIAEIRKKNPKADEEGDVERYLDSILPEAFALVRESGKRTLGMRHFDVQLIGGMVLHGMASPIRSDGQNRGMISEMVTGEGKTLVATLPSYLNALPRRPDEYAYVHVVTVNDYLAKRDCDWNRPLFELLGMSCGAIQSNMDSWDRHPIYGSDIVYGTNSEFGFDYLRDNMKMEAEKQVQKVRHFAIVDEVDSILIDEARTPLIISGSPDGDVGERYLQAAKLAAHLQPTPAEEKDRVQEQRLHGIFEEPRIGHYVVDEKDHSVTLTAEGIRECERYLGIENFYTGKHMDWPHFIDNALKAKELYKKEVQYVIQEGREGKLEVLIVDEHTGRIMYGRRWSDGLHQAVEAKEVLAGEKIEPEAETHTLATVTIQNFFKMYKKLAGMTGTALTEAREFGQIYKLEVVSIPTNRPMRRINYPDVIYGTEREKWEAVCQEIEDVHATGRPILVGTVSVEKSEMLAGLLERRGFKGRFEVLNAKQHAREAIIVAKAGQLGAITVATNMAGRGTDITLGRFTIDEQIAFWQSVKHNGMPLAPKDFDTKRSREEMEEHLIGYWLKVFDKKLFDETPTEGRKAALMKWWREHGRTPLLLAETVKELGGLHIVGSERHEARRIDNQLRGRSGRQGDPGSSRFFLCLDDDLMRIFAKDWVRDFLRYSGMKDGVPLESKIVSRSIEKAQRRVEEHHFGVRKRLLDYDQVMNEQRKLIYGLRQKILESKELKETMMEWVEDVVGMEIDHECIDNPPSQEALLNISEWAKRKFLIELTVQDLQNKTAEEIETLILSRVKAAYEEKDKALGEVEVPKEKPLYYSEAELKLPPEQLAPVVIKKMAEVLNMKESDIRADEILEQLKAGRLMSTVRYPVKERKMRLLERFLLLDIIDTKWKDHLQSMDSLREGIYLRGYAQKDPKLEYKKEGFALFEQMFVSMKEQGTDMILKMQVSEEVEKQEVENVYGDEQQQQATHADAGSAFKGAPPEGAPPVGGGSAEMQAQSEHGGEKLKPVETIRHDPNRREPAPNDPCPCGSGKKWKKCHGRVGGGGLDAIQTPTLPGRPREHKGEVKMGG